VTTTCSTKKCNKCQADLVVGNNWTENSKKNYQNTCNECKKIKSKNYYENNKEKEALRKKIARKANQEKFQKRYKNYYENNKEKEKLRCRNYKKNNKEKIRKQARVYGKNNPEISRAKCAKRRAQKLQALPSWADLEAIKEIYKNCPEGYHVDHIYPLQSDKVCGLHTVENLQYLTAEENLKKGNKMPEEIT
jgi:hypothetical protein